MARLLVRTRNGLNNVFSLARLQAAVKQRNGCTGEAEYNDFAKQNRAAAMLYATI